MKTGVDEILKLIIEDFFPPSKMGNLKLRILYVISHL